MRRLLSAVLLTGCVAFGCGGPGAQKGDDQPRNGNSTAAVENTESDASIEALERQLHTKEPAAQLAAVAKLKRHEKDAIPVLVDALGETNDQVRTAVIDALVELGPDSIPMLVEVLPDYSAAIDALARFGAQAAPQLVDSLRSDDALARQAAVKALIKIGPAAVDTLSEALEEPDPTVRTASLLALSALGEEAIPALMSYLKHARDGARNGDLHREVAAQLRRMGPAAIGPLVQGVTNSDELYFATEALSQFGAAAMPEMAKAYRGGDARQRERVITWMSQFGSAAVPLLAEALADEEIDIVYQAARYLQEVGPAAGYAAPALVKLSQSDDPQRVLLAANTLYRTNADAKIVVPIALRAMELIEDDFDRREASDILRRMGPEAIDALPALLQRVEDGRADEDCVDAIAAIGAEQPDVVVPVIARYIGTGQAGENSADILLANEELLEPHFATLIGGMGDGSAASMLMTALGRRSVPHLTKALKEHPNPQVREGIAYTLARMGPDAAAAHAVIAEAAIKDQDQGVINGAIDGMRWLKVDAKLAVPALIKLMDHENYHIRRDVLGVLEKYESEAESAIERLKKAYAEKKNVNLKGKIAATILKLGGKPPKEKE